jgi:hypothetical protein
MKKISTLIFLVCCFLSCTKDDANDVNPMEGRWYYEQIIYSTDYPDDRGVSSTGSLYDCQGNSFYYISGNHIELKEFLSCENSNTHQGTFDSEKNEIIIGNSSTEPSLYNVRLEDGKLILQNKTTGTINNETVTYTITQICGRQPVWRK